MCMHVVVLTFWLPISFYLRTIYTPSILYISVAGRRAGRGRGRFTVQTLQEQSTNRVLKRVTSCSFLDRHRLCMEIMR